MMRGHGHRPYFWLFALSTWVFAIPTAGAISNKWPSLWKIGGRIRHYHREGRARALFVSGGGRNGDKKNKSQRRKAQNIDIAESENIHRGGYRRLLVRDIRKNTGSLFAAFGFVSCTLTGLVTDRGQYQKVWKPTVASLKAFLKQSGIDKEVQAALSFRLLENLVILSRVQQVALNGRDRRDEAKFNSFSEPNHVPDMQEASRFMRYATAVYGSDMIRAAEMDARGKLDRRILPLTRDKISDHINVPTDDIILMDVTFGGETDYLRHFVAIDHKHKAVVLAIRGSFSASDIFVDAAAYSRPFCGGEAHSEMATQAERVWQVAGGTVRDLLDENRGYELVITGHSLGAGTACLINILCHSKPSFRGKRVRCFAYASPPVFTPLQLVPNAVRSATNYIHERDVIPFLSADSVRRLLACIHAVEQHTKSMNWISRSKLVFGQDLPPPEMLKDVKLAASTRPPPKAGAPVLAIPAATNVWISSSPNKLNFTTKQCDSQALSTLGLFLHPNMLTDHFPARYEHALGSF